jgi:hypothetical protein
MKWTVALVAVGLLAGAIQAGEISFSSPGLPASRMDAQGRLVEDWGPVGITVSGEGLAAPQSVQVRAIKLEDIVPAAQARWQQGPISVTVAAYRAPVWPSGLDVLTARLEDTSGQPQSLKLALALPDGVKVGARTVSLGGRTVVALPAAPDVAQKAREWGWSDDAVSLPGWARPQGDCDPAFRNIRAGLGGVPIHYQFKVEPGASLNVVLGFCESHWSQSGQRPVVCQVEGAPAQELDPLARWGQHQPGVVLFAARDQNSDGRLELSVLPRLGTPDLNPILNIIWIVPPGGGLNLDQVKAGKLNGLALRYVDVGGENDQSLFAGGTVEYALRLPAKGAHELSFLVACPGASAPLPGRTAWTADNLRKAAVQVSQDWRGH